MLLDVCGHLTGVVETVRIQMAGEELAIFEVYGIRLVVQSLATNSRLTSATALQRIHRVEH